MPDEEHEFSNIEKLGVQQLAEVDSDYRNYSLIYNTILSGLFCIHAATTSWQQQ